jgi:hypothetical protein
MGQWPKIGPLALSSAGSNAMTYVVGIKRFNTTAILVDSNFSTVDANGNLRPNENPEEALMKNGVLYPGCIYGYSGNVIRAEQCIQKLRINVATAVGLQAKWEALERTVYLYQFPVGDREQFDLVLSSRHTGTPELFVINSTTEQLHRVEDGICALGSGKKIMDQMVGPLCATQLSTGRLIAIEESNAANGGTFSRLDYPYLLSFFFHQCLYGSHGERLFADHVGGFVHFIRQDGESEERQKPSLYVLAFEDPQTHARTLHRTRIAFDDERIPETLVICDKAYEQPAQWAVSLDNHSAATATTAELQALVRKHQNAVPYYFMAAGVIDWMRYVQPYFFLLDVHTDRRKPWADLTDYLDPFVLGQLIGYMEAPPNPEIARARQLHGYPAR